MKQHRGVWLPDHDDHFSSHLDKGPTFDGHGTYQYSKIEMALKQCRVRHAALDIGAHVGLWSMVLQKYFTHVIAFEPIPEHVECFNKNLAGIGHVTMYDCALGEESKAIKMNPLPTNTGNASVDPHGSLEVDMERLDNFCLPKVSFIKVDVEGFEVSVLKGGEQVIKLNRPVIVVEQKAGHGPRYGFGETEAVDLLKSWGMKVAWVKNGDYCLTF